MRCAVPGCLVALTMKQKREYLSVPRIDALTSVKEFPRFRRIALGLS